jgi:hypothetical protein
MFDKIVVGLLITLLVMAGALLLLSIGADVYTAWVKALAIK